MKSDKQIKSLIKQCQVSSSLETRARLHESIKMAWLQQPQLQPISGPDHRTTSLLAVKGKLAVAAMILVILSTSLFLMDRSVTPTYALAQTATAVQDIQHFHFLLKQGSEPNVTREAWVEYDPNGQLKQVRVNFYDLNNVMVWRAGVTQYWEQDTNELAIFEDQEYTDKILFFVNRHDPKHAIAYLRGLEHKGDVQIEYEEPLADSDPIIFSVCYEPNTYVIGSPKPAMKEIYWIDPSTKVVSQIEVFYLKNGHYVGNILWEYIDYNQPLRAEAFELKHEIPEDCIFFNTLGSNLGLEQGQLSDPEIATQLVKAYLDAWMSQEYDQAVQIRGYRTSGQQLSLMEQVKKNVLTGIVAMDKPRAPQTPLRGLTVTCNLEFSKDGRTIQQTYEFNVREHAPGRWRIMSQSKRNDDSP